MVDMSEPLDSYKKQLKDMYHDECEKYFEELTKSAKISVEENDITCKKYDKSLVDLNKLKKDLNGTKTLKVTFIVIGIIALVVGIILTALGVMKTPKNVLLLTFGIIIAVLGLLSVILAIALTKGKIKMLKAKIAEIEKDVDKLLQEAYGQVASLNNSFDWNIPAKIVNRLNTVITLDNNFDVKKYQYLYEKYGLAASNDKTTSALTIQSGSILGNPFLLLKNLKQDWYTHTYTNSITIHWTTRERTRNGTVTRNHSQVLTAEVDKPAVSYGTATYMIYGNDAAPDLSFSRKPSNADKMTDKQIAKKVSQDSKAFDKRARKELMDNDATTNYTKFGNEEFESLFGGTDRDNEVQFRLLFTPLAQRNLLKLIKSSDGYGDDFYFEKNKKINYIQSNHSQNFDYRTDPSKYVSHDYKIIKSNFMKYNEEFFKSIYFDLAPLMSIPLYQQNKSEDYIYKNNFNGNVTYYEDEVMANSFSKDLLAPAESNTLNILKTTYEKSIDGVDQVKVTAYGFKKISHVEHVAKFGGDGKMHTIPVTWYEFVPVSRDSLMAISNKDSSREEFIKMNNNSNTLGSCLYQRGIFAMLLRQQLDSKIANNMNSCLNSNKNSNISNNVNQGNVVGDALGNVKESIDEATSKTQMNVSNNKGVNQK